MQKNTAHEKNENCEERMDDKFYQFWRDFTSQYLSGQSMNGRIAPDEVSGWLQAGREMSDRLKAMFQKSYQLDPKSFNSSDFMQIFKAAEASFKNSMADFYKILDVVPKQEYRELERKYLALERKLADLEEVIRHLKLLFKTNPPNAEDGIGALNQMLKTQNAQFLKMMDNLAGFYGISKGRDPDEK